MEADMIASVIADCYRPVAEAYLERWLQVARRMQFHQDATTALAQVVRAGILSGRRPADLDGAAIFEAWWRAQVEEALAGFTMEPVAWHGAKCHACTHDLLYHDPVRTGRRAITGASYTQPLYLCDACYARHDAHQGGRDDAS